MTAQITALEAEKATLTTSVETIQADLTAANTQLAALTEEVSELNENAQSIQSSLDDANTQIVALEIDKADLQAYVDTLTSSPGFNWLVGQKCTVRYDVINVRSGPGMDYEIIAHMHKGDRVTIMERCVGSTGKDWYKVNADGWIGWISSGLVELDDLYKGTVNGFPIP